MTKFQKTVSWVAMLIAVFFISLAFPKFTSAQSQCAATGNYSFIKSCFVETSTGACKPVQGTKAFDCRLVNNACVALIPNQICGYLGGVCQIITGSPGSVSIPCGGGSTPTPGGGGGGDCVRTCENISECKQEDNCPGTTGDFCGNDRNGNPRYICDYQKCTTVCPPTATVTPVSTSTPTPVVNTLTPTPVPVAQCQNILAYNNNWVLLTNTQLTQTKAGDQLYYCVTGFANVGTFDKARFTINGVLNPETTLLRPTTTTDYCQAYTVPAAVYDFNIVGEIHHTTLGWVQ